MATYGVTAEGFVRKPLEVIIEEINEYLWANVSPTLDVSPESPQGQINSAFARQLNSVWELAEILYHGNDPDGAEDFLLQNLAKLTGTAKQGATKSRVTATVNLDIGTTLISETHYANVSGQPDNRWTPEEDFTAPSTGNHSVVFVAEFAGPVVANASTLNVINTSLTGWNSITNAASATTGEEAQDDEDLRAAREEDLAKAGSATLQAVIADAGEVSGVAHAHGYQNRGSVADANGLPPHSLEIVIDDGAVPDADDDELAQAIFDSTTAGIQWYSNDGNSGTALDGNGDEHTVGFSRVQFVNIHFAYELETGAGYVGDASVKEYVKERAEELYDDELGPEVLYAAMFNVPLDQVGVTDIVSFTLDITDTPVATDNIQLTARQKAVFDTANIDVSVP